MSQPPASAINAVIRAFEQRSYSEMERAAQALSVRYPTSPFAWKALGLALLLAGRGRDAMTPLQRSIELKADDPEVFFYVAAAWRGLGQLDRAAASYLRAIELRPEYGDARFELGSILIDQGRFAEAEPHFRQSIAANPLVARSHLGLGIALRRLDRIEEAETCFRRAASLEPNNPVCHYNLGNFLRDTGRFEEAERSFRRVLEIDRGHLLAMNNLAETLSDLGRFKEALAVYDKALSIKPDYASANHNKALTLLLLGDWTSGLQLYEWRKRKLTEPVGNRQYSRPMLSTIDDVANKVVLVHWEQGLGDTIQFCRYLPLLAAQGAKVLFAPQDNLRRLMASLPGNIDLVDVECRQPFDCHVPLLSLPLAFCTAVATIPAAKEYLRAQPDRVERWRAKLGDHGFKIGICWQGKADHHERSFPLSHLAGVGRVPGVRLISLHKGAGEVQLDGLPEGMVVETLGENFDVGLDAFLDTAAVMKLCDLVISSDTAVAHLGGALGIRTWVALRAVPDWRWLLERRDSPWYPTVRLFRQRTPGDWGSVFREMEVAMLENGASEEE
jgi:tetratricopeptide (TPR) repeat protein